MKCVDCNAASSYACSNCGARLCADCYTSTSLCAKCMQVRSSGKVKLGARVRLTKDRFFIGELGTVTKYVADAGEESFGDDEPWEDGNSVYVKFDNEGITKPIIPGKGYKATLSSRWIEKDKLQII